MTMPPIHRTSHRLTVLAATSLALLLVFSPAFAAEKRSKPDADVSREISQAYDAMKSYGYEKKEAFLAWAQERSGQLQRQIDNLDGKIDQANDEVRSELMEARREMQQEKRELAKSMKRVRKSSKAAWEDAKWGVSAAMEKLERAYERALSRFEQADGRD